MMGIGLFQIQGQCFQYMRIYSPQKNSQELEAYITNIREQ